ncbi:MAG TPA: 50S ribosomal protein L31 [Anaerolineae bacterium]|nr:50S ribosomal protein L31 [Anaerolineae bacterium]
MKNELHPKWYPDAQVICNGEVVMTVGATAPELHVEVWSGTHPFYTGQQRIVDTEGQVERFVKRLERREGLEPSSKRKKAQRRRERQTIVELVEEDEETPAGEAATE